MPSGWVIPPWASANLSAARGIWTASRGSDRGPDQEDDMEPTRTRSNTRRLAILAAVVGVLAVACGSSAPTATNRSTAPSAPAVVASTNPSAAATVIPVGRYVGVTQQVADIVERLQRDSSLSETERAAILDNVLEIRGARTYQTTLDVHDGSRFDLITTIDGKDPDVEHWSMLPIDDHRFAVDTDCCGVQVYEVRRLDRGFQLFAKSPASSNVERFVRSVVFETGPFAEAQ